MDTAKIKEITSIFECSSLSSMHLEADDMKITLKKEGSAAVSAPLSISVPAPEAAAPVPERPAAPAVQGEAVRSPLVGTFLCRAGSRGQAVCGSRQHGEGRGHAVVVVARRSAT